MDGSKDQSSGEDVVMEQGYPSPNMDVQDAGAFYAASARDEVGHQNHSGDATQVTSEDDGNELQALRDDHEKSLSHQQQSTTSVSAEELQLAARLTEGLAPMIAAHAAQGLHRHAEDVDKAEPHIEEPSLQDQLRQQLQNSGHDFHDGMANPEDPSQSQYMPPPGQAASLPQHLGLEQLAQAQFGVDLNTPPRKRSKVSRACDECRRKKIKCDALSESADEPCSNCRKSNARCLFSRVPQKRGPSKGYIKELADRIHSIEGKLGGGVDLLDGLSRRASAEAFTSSLSGDDSSRKRPYSTISGENVPTPTPVRQSAWGFEQRPVLKSQTSSQKTSYSANNLAPKPIAPNIDGIGFARSGGLPDSQTENAAQADQTPELDESVFLGYLTVIHQSFPVLAGTRSRVQATLAQCPPLLQQAFIEAFYAAMQSFQTLPQGFSGDSRVANRILTDWEAENTPGTPLTDVVMLQVRILMILESDNLGPSSLRGQHGVPAKSKLLARAIGEAVHLKLWDAHIDPKPNPEKDLDGEDMVLLRCWWTLVMLDRWHAIGTSAYPLIPRESIVVLPGLRYLLGNAVYHLIHLSMFIEELVPLTQDSDAERGSGGDRRVASLVTFAIDSFRWHLPEELTPLSHPVIHLAYWHIRLLSSMLPSSLSQDLLWAARENVGLLAGNPQLLSPLNHHFTALVTLSLLELSKSDDATTRDESTKLARTLLENEIAPSCWDYAIRDRIAEKIRPSTSAGVDSQNLQHLADLATATELVASSTEKMDKVVEAALPRKPDNYEALGFDPRSLLRAGYLTAFAEADSQGV